MFLELAVLWLVIFFGVRYSGVALGLFGGAGLWVLSFCFGLSVTAPPMDVVMLILSVVCASACLQAAGALDDLVTLAEKILWRYPRMLGILAPIFSYGLTVFTGTGHLIYTLLPIIVKIAKKTGISPEKSLAASVVASQIGISASPLSAATVATLGLFADQGMSLPKILFVTIPSTFLAVLITGLYGFFTTQALHSQELCDSDLNQGKENLPNKKRFSLQSQLSLVLFLGAICCIVIFGAYPSLRPLGTDGEALTMGYVISLTMLLVGTCVFLLSGLTSQKVVETQIFRAGLQAVIAIFGVAWLGDVFISHHTQEIRTFGQSILIPYPFLFGFLMFGASILVYSQAATLRIMLPLGILIGLPTWLLMGLLPSVNGLFVIPNYPTVIAAIEFDDTKQTKVGRFLFNHSFLIPGLMTVFISVIMALLISYSLR